MSVTCRTVGLAVRVDSASSGWLRLAREACAGQEITGDDPDVHVVIHDAERRHLRDLRDDRSERLPDGRCLLTRGAWRRGSAVLMDDVAGSGLRLEITPSETVLRVRAWAHPTWRHRGLGLLAPDRRVLLHRAALIQYPALWWAGVKGLVPMHVSAARVAGEGVVLAGPGGVGKSTLLSTAEAPEDVAVSDNLCAVGGGLVHGLLEPTRGSSGTGRRMPHGRRESPWSARLDSIAPQHVLVLRRGSGDEVAVQPIGPAATVRELTAGTYAAGELRRYWAFAATLALATGLGPAHPPVERLAEALAAVTECSEVVLPRHPGVTLRDIMSRVGPVRLEETGRVARPAPGGAA